jgi:RNA-directed DNA polymerase
MRATDTGQLDLFGERARSGAAALLIDRPHEDLRPGGVDRAIDRLSTPATPSTPGTRTSATAIRTTGTRATRTGRGRSAACSGAGVSFSELVAADLDCRRHKRMTPAARAWEGNREANLYDLCEDLNAGTYTPGPSICFVVTRPKPREVWAAGYRDRVVHHLLYRAIGSRFERAFIADSCACIAGRGTLYAARRLEHKVRAITANWTRPAWYLKCDLANFFPSIRKDILAGLLLERVPEPFWRRLALLVLFHDPRPGVELRGNPERLARIPPHKSLFSQPPERGLPIGNLPSQFGANVYLGELDRFVKHRLRVRHYVRYVDDFILLHESPRQLNAWRAEIERFLPARLAVELNPRKTVLQPIERGIDFVGQVLKPHRRTLRRRTLNAGLARLVDMPSKDVYAAANSYLGLARQATHGHRDRARIANLARRRGFAVDRELTKVYP